MTEDRGKAEAGISFWLGLVAMSAIGVSLRLSRIGHGLPDFLEEAIPLRTAMEMWGWGGKPDDFNPHMFQYPSLSIYLHYLIQKLGYFLGHIAGRHPTATDYLLDFVSDPTGAVRLSRSLGIAADGTSVILVGMLGRRFGSHVGLTAAALVALAPSMIVTSSAIFTDNLMVALALAALERMIVYLEGGKTSSLITSAILIGLAAGTKYPAAVLLLPLAWVSWLRNGRQVWRPMLWAIAISGGAFLVTTPFALLDFNAFAADLLTVSERMGTGHLGVTERAGASFYWHGLRDNVGWTGIAAAALSLALVRRWRVALLLWISLLAFALPTGAARAEFERYLVPLIPLAAILVAAGATWVLFRVTPSQSPPWLVRTLVAVLTLVPPIPGAIRAARAGQPTQITARKWFEANVGQTDMVLQEAYGAQVLTRSRRDQIMPSRLFRSAGKEAQRRFLARRWYHVTPLPMITAGPRDVRVSDSSIVIVPHAVDLNAPFYDLRFLRGVDVVVISSAVRSRYDADTIRFHAQRAFYRFLESSAEIAASFSSRSGGEGPDITIYRLGPRAEAAIDSVGTPPVSWWTTNLLRSEPRRAAEKLAAHELDMETTGQDLAWLEAARGFYGRWYGPFLSELIKNHHHLGRCDETHDFALIQLAMLPEDVEALLAMLRCADSTGLWTEARRAAEWSLPQLASQGVYVPEVALEYATVLARTGEPERARRGLESLAAAGQGDASLEARRRLIHLPYNRAK